MVIGLYVVDRCSRWAPPEKGACGVVKIPTPVSNIPIVFVLACLYFVAFAFTLYFILALDVVDTRLIMALRKN